jgi:hypothetical protein
MVDVSPWHGGRKEGRKEGRGGSDKRTLFIIVGVVTVMAMFQRPSGEERRDIRRTLLVLLIIVAVITTLVVARPQTRPHDTVDSIHPDQIPKDLSFRTLMSLTYYPLTLNHRGTVQCM